MPGGNAGYAFVWGGGETESNLSGLSAGSLSVTITRGRNRRIEAVCLSILGGIQPGKLQAYIRDAVRGGVGDDGLLQRFGLLVWPDDSREWSNIDRWPESAARTKAFEVFTRLDAMEPDTDPDNGEIIPKEYRFTEDATDASPAPRAPAPSAPRTTPEKASGMEGSACKAADSAEPSRTRLIQPSYIPFMIA